MAEDTDIDITLRRGLGMARAALEGPNTDCAMAAARALLALDEWIRGGGELPDRWASRIFGVAHVKARRAKLAPPTKEDLFTDG